MASSSSGGVSASVTIASASLDASSGGHVTPASAFWTTSAASPFTAISTGRAHARATCFLLGMVARKNGRSRRCTRWTSASALILGIS